MKNYSRAKVLTLIPIIFFIVTVVCLTLAAILEEPTSGGTLYSIFAIVGLMGLVLSPIPSLVMAIIGVIFAVRAKKEGETKALKFLILGIVEILFSISGVILAFVIVIGGQGV